MGYDCVDMIVGYDWWIRLWDKIVGYDWWI